VTAISATPLGLDVLYEFLSANLNRTLNELSDGPGTVNHIYSVLASKVTEDRDIANVSAIVSETRTGESGCPGRCLGV